MTPTSPFRLLYLEDQAEDVELLTDRLEREYFPCDITWVNGRQAFESALTGGWSFDLILADYGLPDIQGEEALALARNYCPTVPFIFVSGSLGEEKAVECLRAGATDYVTKSHLARLAPVLKRALAEAREAAARQEAEAATLRMVGLLRATLESTAEGILVVDLAGKISTYNRKFMTLCGIPDYVMAPMEIERVLQFLGDQFQNPEAFLAEARLLGGPDPASFKLVNHQGDRMLEGSSRPNGLSAQAQGRVFSFRDVTARELAAQSLTSTANTRLQLVEAAAAVGVVSWALDQGGLLMAYGVEALLDLPSGGRPVQLAQLEALIHPEDLEDFRQALNQPRPGPLHIRLRKQDTWFWTQWRVARDEAGGCRGVVLDISEQRAQEEAAADLRGSLRLAHLAENTAKAIRSLLRQLQEPLEQMRAAGAMRANHENAAHTLARIEVLLDQAGLSMRCEPDFSHLLEIPKVLEGFQAIANTFLAPGTRLELQAASDLPPLPMSAPHLLQIFLNLFLNALEAVHGSGSVRIKVAREPGGVLLEVQDDGSGIPPRVRSRMFEPFFSTREGADGLGLAVVRSIVEGYRGTIQVHSAPGKGTTMHIHLPVK